MFSTNEWIFRKEVIEETDGVTGKLYRCKTIWFLEDLGAAAKLDRRVTSTASVYFHRFFLFHSFATHDRFKVSVACLFLAAKAEESAIRLKDIVHKYYEIRHSGIFPDEKTISEFHKCVILIERLVLNTLNFDLYVVHPNIAGKYKDLKNLIPDESKHSALQTAINFVNDSYRSTLCLQYQSNHIAIAMLYLAMIVLQVKPINRSNAHVETTWISLLEKEVDHIILRNICFDVLDLYELTADKATKIKNKNFIKDQIRGELGDFQEELKIAEDTLLSSSLSPSHLTDQEMNDDHKYEEENDEFNLSKQPKVTVTHVRKGAIAASIQSSVNPESTPFLPPPPPSLSPTNGSESVYSTASISHGGYNNEYEFTQEETPFHQSAETPMEGGSSVYHSFLEVEDNPSDTPSFQDLQRLPARERATSISEGSYLESNKRPRLV